MSRPGRNDPCHCGSGRKYKKCCLSKDRQQGHVKGGSPQPSSAPSSSSGPPLETRSLRTSGLPNAEKLETRLAGRRDEIFRTLDQKGVLPLIPKASDRLKVAFEQARRGRWLARARDDANLVEAREEIEAVESVDKFDARSGQTAYEERRQALADPLETLASAGEDGIPHLGALLHTDSWASPLAAAEIVDLEETHDRHVLMIEALFLPGDWVPDLCLRNGDEIPQSDRLPTFEHVAEEAAVDGIELQGTFWTGLFEDVPEATEDPIEPRPGFGPALEVLYDAGHFDALARGIESRLDPSFAGPESVEAFLADDGVQAALQHVGATDAPDRLALEAPTQPR